MGTILYYLIPIAVGLVALVLFAGLWNMMRGGSSDRSQKLMRARVIMQGVAVAIIMGAVYFLNR